MRPGIITKDAEGRVKCLPIYSRIVGLFTGANLRGFLCSEGETSRDSIAQGFSCQPPTLLLALMLLGRPGKALSTGDPPTNGPKTLLSPPPHTHAESNALQYAVPGGLIGVGLTVDPTLTRADRLVGQVRPRGFNASELPQG